MKTALLTLLFATSLAALSATAKADDRCYDGDRGYRHSRSYEQCEPRRYSERPRSYYRDEEVVIQPRRYVVREDDGCRPSYRRHSHHHLSFRSFFGGW